VKLPAIPKSPQQALSLARELLSSPKYSIYRNFAFFSAASLAGNFFAFLFHFYSARQLSVADYGSLNVLLALFGVLILPFGSFASLLIKKVAQRKQDAPSIAIEAAKVALASGAITLALLLVFSSQFNSLFHFQDNAIPILFGLTLALAFFWTSLNGVLQGLERFFLSGTAFAAGSLAKLGLAFLLASTGLLGLPGALASYGITFLITSAMAFWGLRSLFLSPGAKRYDLSGFKADYLQIVAIDIGLALIFNGDLVVLGHLFPGDSLGFYSAAAIIAKIISYALLPLAAVAFPKMVEQAAGSQKPKALFATLGLVLAGGLFILAFYALAGPAFLSLLYTEKYLAATQYLMLLSLSMVFYCLNMVASRYFVATGRRLYSLFALLLPIAGLALLYLAGSIALAPLVMLGTNLALFAAGAALFPWNATKSRA
jgi:O-antigen/teichoic acid export membrane protein